MLKAAVARLAAYASPLSDQPNDTEAAFAEDLQWLVVLDIRTARVTAACSLTLCLQSASFPEQTCLLCMI